MKLEPFLKENKSKRMKMIITESQLRMLAQNAINEQENGTIKKTFLVKQQPNVKKK